MPKILLIDNYDSFTFNLYHYLEELNEEGVEVMRNDKIDLDKVTDFQKIVISPGPGLPKQAGDLMKLLELYFEKKAILGVCLGQQAIAEHVGMKLKNLKEVVHGQSRQMEIMEGVDSIFQGLPERFKVGRYHSWVIDPASFSADFKITAKDEQGNIMGIKHKKLPIEAVQFHPESILTEFGKEMIKNWLK
jgi:anthranilate synthase component 2